MYVALQERIFLHEATISPAMKHGGPAVGSIASPLSKELPMAEPLVVRREVQIAAPPATVFAFLTDPQKILRWMGTEADVEPHPGGLYLVNVSGKDIAKGRFIEVIPVHRLAYTFGWDHTDEWNGEEKVPPGSSLIEIDLIEKAGGTLLRLTHSGLPDAETCASHEMGWTHYIGRLTVAAAGGDPGPDTHLKTKA